MPPIHISLRARSFVGRIVYTILALTLLVLGFFFLAAALVAGTVLAAVLLARVWWVRRKLMKSAEERFIAAEYKVVEREMPSKPPLDAEKSVNGER